jgi:hypothetical protein
MLSSVGQCALLVTWDGAYYKFYNVAMLATGKGVSVRLVYFISLLLSLVLAALRSYTGMVTGDWRLWRFETGQPTVLEVETKRN